MTNFISKLFVNADFISSSYNFEYNGSQLHKTNQGALFSIIAFVTALIITIMFGREVYLRKSPNVSSSKEYAEESVINIQDFPFLFALFDQTGANYTLIDYFDVTIWKFSLDNNVNLQFENNFELINCEGVNFRKYKEVVFTLLSQSDVTNMCLKSTNSDGEEVNFKNFFGDPNSSKIRFDFDLCVPDNTNKNTSNLDNASTVNRQCKVNDEFIHKTPTISIKYANSFTNSLDFNFPVIEYLDFHTTPVSKGLHKMVDFYFLKNEYISDNG